MFGNHHQPDPHPISNQSLSYRASLPDNTHHAVAKVPLPLFVSPQLSPQATTALTPPYEVLPRLSGIVISGGVGHAIFEHEGQLQESAVGDHLGAYQILEIAPTTVTVQGPQGIQEVHTDTEGGNGRGVEASASGGSQPSSLLDKLNTQPPLVVPLPRPPSLTQMLSRLPRSH